MDRARYAVDAVVLEGRTFRQVASSLGMSKSWVTKQVARFQAGGYEALVAGSKAPHRRPTQTPVELENEIVALRSGPRRRRAQRAVPRHVGVAPHGGYEGRHRGRES
jgi:transposase